MVNSSQNWETQEVIQWLLNDEDSYTSAPRTSARDLKAWVIAGNAPQGLYEAFNEPPKSSFTSVKWSDVVTSLKDR